MKITQRLLCILLGLIFCLAAFSKFSNLVEFNTALANFVFLPRWAQGLITLFLPSVELTVGVYLLIGKSPVETSTLALLLIGAFLCFSLYMIATGYHTCPCMKLPLEFQMKGWGIVTRNCVLLTMCLANLWLCHRQQLKRDADHSPAARN